MAKEIDLQKMNREIFEIALSLASNQDVDSLLIQIGLAVEKMTGSAAASILLLDADKKQLVFKVATGEKGPALKKFYVPLGKGIAGWVAEKGEAVIVNDVQTDERFSGQLDKSSGFSTKSILAVPMFIDGELLGVCEALNKMKGDFTEEDRQMLQNLAALAAITINNARISEDNRNFFSHMLEVITMSIEGVDTRLTGHSYRTAELACMIGRQMGIQGEEYKTLYLAALLHDIGILALHNLNYLPNVVNKTIERTPDKLHPLIGAELVKDIKLLAKIAPIILHHHEYVDGSGHPDGLVGDDIPMASRIICVAEAVDELRIAGFVGEAQQERATKLVSEGAGTKFDKSVVEAYLAASA